MGTYHIAKRVASDADIGKKKSKWKRYLLLLLILLMLFVSAVMLLHHFGYIRYPWESGGIVGRNVKQGALPNMTEDELKEYMQKRADEGQVSVRINSRPTFGSGSGEGSLMIQNARQNKHDMVARIYLGSDNTGTLLYSSGRIPPDHYIDYDTLNTVLPKGEHGAIAYLTFYDGDSELNTASFKLTIVVKS